MMEDTYVVHFNTIKILLYTTIIDWFDWLSNWYIQVQSGYEAAFLCTMSELRDESDWS